MSGEGPMMGGWGGGSPGPDFAVVLHGAGAVGGVAVDQARHDAARVVAERVVVRIPDAAAIERIDYDDGRRFRWRWLCEAFAATALAHRTAFRQPPAVAVRDRVERAAGLDAAARGR